jgi:hypothetical protein
MCGLADHMLCLLATVTHFQHQQFLYTQLPRQGGSHCAFCMAPHTRCVACVSSWLMGYAACAAPAGWTTSWLPSAGELHRTMR